uniref:calpain-5-like isoform X1 n=1 Tax=Myxine glutinosa TaxID=7769 RepID=UPI00358FBE07
MRLWEFRGQSYARIREECESTGQPFQDPSFPPENESLVVSKGSTEQPVQWKRPWELCEAPRLVVDGISAQDLHQGALGNCWFVAACSCLATQESIWRKVIPDMEEQEWDRVSPRSHPGIFRFVFCRFGRRVEVVVDDRLPTTQGKLLYCHSSDANEFWSALLEKAYAKLNGCYEALDGGSVAEALVDFTAGVSERIRLARGDYATDVARRYRLYSELQKAHKHGALLACYIEPALGEIGTQMPCGLVKGHAYAVTAVRAARTGASTALACTAGEKILLLQLRNPWGRREWVGAWGDQSPEWKGLSHAEKECMKVTVNNDGEFWMSMEDWCREFTDAIVCRMPHKAWFSLRKNWQEATIFGEWSPHPEVLKNRAGGCGNHPSHLQNPQYAFEVSGGGTEFMFYLEQEERAFSRSSRTQKLTIGFEIFKVELNRRFRIHGHASSICRSEFINSRAVFRRQTLSHGRYVLVPCTFEPGQAERFLLRIFSEYNSRLQELANDSPKRTCWNLMLGYPVQVTSLTLQKASGLGSSGNKVYAVICCEGQKVRTADVDMQLETVFDAGVIFYQKHPERRVTIQLWLHGVLSDTLLGEAEVPGVQTDSDRTLELPLRHRGKQAGEEESVTRSVTVETVTNNDLKAL